MKQAQESDVSSTDHCKPKDTGVWPMKSLVLSFFTEMKSLGDQISSIPQVVPLITKKISSSRAGRAGPRNMRMVLFVWILLLVY